MNSMKIWATTLGLGFVSAVFDNIPLTSLALHQVLHQCLVEADAGVQLQNRGVVHD